MPAKAWCKSGFGSQPGPSRNSRNAGAAPKLTTSHKLSSSPPKLLADFDQRATEPSSASKIMAATISQPLRARKKLSSSVEASGLPILLA